MTTVIQLDATSELHALAELLGKHVEIAYDSENRKWLRVADANPQLHARLCHVPGRCFRLSDDGWLIRAGDQVASAALEKDLQWRRLDDQLNLELPIAALAGRLDSSGRRTLRLVRGGRPEKAAAAIVSIEDLHNWVDLASEVRLCRLRWVVRDSEALVMGEPLPPIHAHYLVAVDRILVPAGWKWLPEVPAGDLCRAARIQRDQWLVWHRPTEWGIVDDDSLVTLRRAAVRRLSDGQSHGVA